MTRRMVVVGGDAAGMSAASTALRHAPAGELEVVVFERGHHTSYSACGIPYWIAGEVPDGADLIARSPAEHRRAGIDLRMRSEVTAIDLERNEVAVREVDGGAEYHAEYRVLRCRACKVGLHPAHFAPHLSTVHSGAPTASS